MTLMGLIFLELLRYDAFEKALLVGIWLVDHVFYLSAITAGAVGGIALTIRDVAKRSA